MSKALLVTTFNNHYRDGLFRALRERLDLDLLFYSDGGEWYWRGTTMPVDHLGARTLPGFWIGHTRIVPSLVRCVWTGHYDVLVKCTNGKFALPVCYLAAKTRGKPFVLWTGLWKEPASLSHRSTRSARRLVERSADALVTYGRHVSARLTSEGVNTSKIFDAPQAVSNERFNSPRLDSHTIERTRRRFIIGSNERIVLFVGRLESEKGVMTLLEAFGLVSRSLQVRLVLAGEGSLRPRIEEEVARRGIAGRVNLTGQTPNADLPDLYRMADIVAVPSEATALSAETWSIVVNEAMASGACVVASDCVGAVRHGLLRDEDTGLVFPAGNAEALAATLLRALRDEQLRVVLASAGCEEVQGYTFNRMALAFEQAIEFALRVHTNAAQR